METVLTTLSVGHKSISWELGFRFNGTHYAYLTSHVNELTDLSPGRLHMDLSQRLCLADGQKVFDLMVPNDQHKASWSSTTVNCDDYFLPLSAGGHLFGSLYLRLLRPLLRRGYYAMSPRLLRLLKPITRH
jgi:CelD/BcsL family acetyltransferase involved in cellulose biosynthesis